MTNLKKKTREVKIEWTKQLVAQQKQKTERIKKETMLQNAKLDAQRVKDVRTTFSFAKESKHKESNMWGLTFFSKTLDLAR